MRAIAREIPRWINGRGARFRALVPWSFEDADLPLDQLVGASYATGARAYRGRIRSRALILRRCGFTSGSTGRSIVCDGCNGLSWAYTLSCLDPSKMRIYLWINWQEDRMRRLQWLIVGVYALVPWSFEDADLPLDQLAGGSYATVARAYRGCIRSRAL